jgi:hypothetical protein
MINKMRSGAYERALFYDDSKNFIFATLGYKYGLDSHSFEKNQTFIDFRIRIQIISHCETFTSVIYFKIDAEPGSPKGLEIRMY